MVEITHQLLELLFHKPPYKVAEEIPKWKLNIIGEWAGCDRAEWLDKHWLVYYIVKSPWMNYLYRAYFYGKTADDIIRPMTMEGAQLYHLCHMFRVPGTMPNKETAAERLVEEMDRLRVFGETFLIDPNKVSPSLWADSVREKAYLKPNTRYDELPHKNRLTA